MKNRNVRRPCGFPHPIRSMPASQTKRYRSPATAAGSVSDCHVIEPASRLARQMSASSASGWDE